MNYKHLGKSFTFVFMVNQPFLVELGMAALVLILLTVPLVVSHSYQEETDLRRDMFKTYSSSVRPVLDQSAPVLVSFSFELLNIEAMHITTQTMTVTAWCIARWEDELMKWNRTKYGGAEKFYVHDGDDFDIWKPNIIVMNTIGEFVKIGNADLPIVVESSGEINMEAGVSLSTHCDVDITFYPFDTQTCEIIIGAVVYSVSEVNMTIAELSTENYRKNGEWDLIDLAESSEDIKLDEHSETLLKFTFTLQRLRPFFLMNLIIPLMLLSCLNVVVFALPVSSGERMGLSITTLLSFAVFLSVIGDSLPKTSRNSPIVGIYVLITFILSTLSVCLSVLVLNLHGRQGEPVPRCLHRIFGKLQPEQKTHKMRHGKTRSARVTPISGANSDPEVEITDYDEDERDDDDEMETTKDVAKAKVLTAENLDKNIDWYTVARKLDRCLFWAFFVICVLVLAIVVGVWLTH